MLRSALRADDIVPFLVTGTMVAEIALNPPEAPPPGDAGLLDSLLEVDIAETTALLHLVAALAEDELTRARIKRVLATRRQPVPPTVSEFASLRVTQAWFMGDELGDADNVILGIEWPSGAEATAVVLIDHNLGTIAKDAFFIGADGASVVARYHELADESGASIGPVPIDLASARARIQQAITRFLDSGFEPADDDPDIPGQWPQCSVLLTHVLDGMPVGGEAYDVDHDCDPEALAEIVTDFLQSPEASALPASDDTANLAGWLTHFAQHEGGDPLRWSAVNVEIALVQALPFEPELTDAQLDLVPSVLPALVRYAHRETRISPPSQAETHDSIARWLPEFEQTRQITAPMRAEFAARAAILGSPLDWHQYMLRRAAGTDTVDLEPLPDEPLLLDGVPEDLHPVVTEISGHLDRLVDEAGFAALGIEFRTACRRFLVGAAAGDPAVLRRRAKPLNTAATIAWMVGRGNELVGYSPAPVGSGDLQAWFGVSGLSSDRGHALLDAFHGGHAPKDLVPTVALGDARLLVGECRRELRRAVDQAAQS